MTRRALAAATLAFLLLLPYRRDTRGTWRTRGTFIAFVIALMTEMFGWPLLIHALSPLIDIPSLRGLGLGHTGAILGTWPALIGLLLIVAGWRRIHGSGDLVTDGVYRFVRHPQYTGLILFTFGWILHWPAVLTLLLWPVLVAAYVWLARREEHVLHVRFGDAYAQYAAKTPRFFPRLR